MELIVVQILFYNSLVLSSLIESTFKIKGDNMSVLTFKISKQMKGIIISI